METILLKAQGYELTQRKGHCSTSKKVQASAEGQEQHFCLWFPGRLTLADSIYSLRNVGFTVKCPTPKISIGILMSEIALLKIATAKGNWACSVFSEPHANLELNVCIHFSCSIFIKMRNFLEGCVD